jgi:hypothetical protein
MTKEVEVVAQGTNVPARRGRLTIVGAGYRMGHCTVESLGAMRLATKLFSAASAKLRAGDSD